jgi:molecular chaperone GrpE
MTESNNSVENSTAQPMEAPESPDLSTHDSTLPSEEQVLDPAVGDEPIAAEAAVDLQDSNSPDINSQDSLGDDGDTAAMDSEMPVAFDSLELEPEEEVVGETATAAGELDSARTQALALEIQVLKQQIEERDGQYLRITADFENFRKRTRKEQEELDERSKCNTILELLPVIDNFERARTQLKAEGEEAINIHKSYQGIYKQLVECLKRVGVVPMRAKGKEFDPMLHEAVMREPSSEFEDGIVIEELQRGYLLGDRVLRHAMVKVAVAGEPAPEAAGEEDNASAEG